MNFPDLLAVPAELETLQEGAVGRNGGYQVLKLDLEGDPLSCSDGEHAQVLQFNFIDIDFAKKSRATSGVL